MQTIGEPGVEEVGDEYVVYWEGDVGCAGGNGSVSGVLSVVRKNGFGQPLVEPYLKSPEIKMVCADKIAVSNGFVTLSGITYGDDDSQHSPSKPIEIVLKAEYEQFKMVKKKYESQNKDFNEVCREYSIEGLTKFRAVFLFDNFVRIINLEMPLG